MHTYNVRIWNGSNTQLEVSQTCDPWWAGTFVRVAMVLKPWLSTGGSQRLHKEPYILRALWWLQWQVDDSMGLGSITGTDRGGKTSKSRGVSTGNWKRLTVQSSCIPSWMATKRGPRLPTTEKELTHFSASQSLMGSMVQAFSFLANRKQSILKNWPKPRHQISLYVFRLMSF